MDEQVTLLIGAALTLVKVVVTANELSTLTGRGLATTHPVILF